MRRWLSRLVEFIFDVTGLGDRCTVVVEGWQEVPHPEADR